MTLDQMKEPYARVVFSTDSQYSRVTPVLKVVSCLKMSK